VARYNDAEEENGEDEDDFGGSGSDAEADADGSTSADTNAQQLRRHSWRTDNTVAMPKATPTPNATKRVESNRKAPTRPDETRTDTDTALDTNTEPNRCDF
jgi:hypothetical protein